MWKQWDHIDLGEKKKEDMEDHQEALEKDGEG